MILQTLHQRPGSRVLTSKILGHLGGWICGAAVLYWVALQAGPRMGTAIVHVTEPNVQIDVGGRLFRVGANFHEPIVCDLPAGEYQLTMTRDSTLLYAVHFSIEGGEEQVLATWKPPDMNTSRNGNGAPWTDGSASGNQFPMKGLDPRNPEASLRQ